MYEDSWYSGFVSRAKPVDNKGKHRRRESLLKQPNEGQADVARAEVIVEAIPEAPEKSNVPPPATVARRARSYSDFYDVVRAHIKKEKAAERKKSRENLSNDLDFAEWYGGINEELLDASHEEHKLYQKQLSMTRNHLDNIVSDTTIALDTLSALTDSFQAVESQTTSFQTQCQGLIEDQQRITKLAEDLETNLRYYLYLEPMTKRLNAPGAGNIVRGKEFTGMLANLDSCLEYMQKHSDHRESATYRSRYRLLLTRALTFIRVHFTNALREIAADVSKRIADRQLNDTTMSALLYAKFRVGAPELKQLGLEIQKRAVLPKGAEPGAEAEYQSLMNELYQSYSATRGRLILPLVTKKIGEIAQAPSTSKDLVSFARSSISYIRGICFDEYDLWGQWFEGDGGVYDFLESMCEPLYDQLRPKTIHETQILKLCELCTLIQTRYMEEDEESDSADDTDKLDFAAIVHPALQDAQSRLVFLSLAILRDDIERYKPKPADLDYPAKNRRSSLVGGKSSQPALSGTRAPKTDVPPTPQMPKTPMVVEEDKEDDGAGDASWNFNTEAAFKDWYPTLRKAIWLLSKIYRLVHSSVFDDIAHRIVHSTTVSLRHAATLLSKSASPTDAALFLISHLLLLKQQIVAFDIEFVTPETNVKYDVFSITNTFWELRARGGLFNPRNLVGLLIPKVVSNMLDAKVEVDTVLRKAITDLTGQFADRLLVPVAKPASTSAAVATAANPGPQPPRTPLKFPAAEAPARTAKIRESLAKETPFLRQKLEAYLSDARTREMLVVACMETLVAGYEAWFESWSTSTSTSTGGAHHANNLTAKGAAAGDANGKSNGKSWGRGRGKGKASVDAVWDPDVFGEWCGGTMGVGAESGSGGGAAGVEEGGFAGERGNAKGVGLGLGLGLSEDEDGGDGSRGDEEEERSASMRTRSTGLRIRM